MSWQGSHPSSQCISNPKGHEGADIQQRSAANLQRPETVESLFFLWRTTRDPKWREQGWLIMQELNQTRGVPSCALLASESLSFVPAVETGGFASVHNVYAADNLPLADKQESFFIAEELKYLFLLFAEDNEMNGFVPEQWVFNTEVRHSCTRRPCSLVQCRAGCCTVMRRGRSGALTPFLSSGRRIHCQNFHQNFAAQ